MPEVNICHRTIVALKVEDPHTEAGATGKIIQH
jgi:hypothetical protein